MLESASVLIEAGADVNAQTTKGNTFLSLAVTSTQLRRQGVKVRLLLHLLQAGADPDLADGRAIEQAFRNYTEPEVVAAFVEVGIERDIRYAAALGEIDTLRSFFHDDGRLAERALRLTWREVPDSVSADLDALNLGLSYAAFWNQVEAADFLLDRGADVNSQPTGFYFHEDRGSSALHRAADAGRLEMVRLLLDRGANPTQQATQWGGTPRDWTRYADHTEVQEVLREAEESWPETHPEGSAGN